MRGWLLLLLLLLGSCGYRFTEERCLADSSTICVPYVTGDCDGRLTEALIHQLSIAGFRYRQSSRYRLDVEITCRGRENLGYRFDEPEVGEVSDRLLPDEGRLIITTEVTLMDCRRGCALFGPLCFTESVDYAFDPLSIRNELTQTSLGQFVAIDQAEDAAYGPLYEATARKIVDYLRSAW